MFYRPGHKSLIATILIILAILVLLFLSCQPIEISQDTINIGKSEKKENAAEEDAEIEVGSSSSLPGFLSIFRENVT